MLAEERNARVTLDADLSRAGLVVLGEALTDGWSVEVDGRPSRALHVDEVMRGVVVPAGRHQVVWRFTVPGLRAGALLSLLAVLAVACGVAAHTTRTRLRRARAVLR